MSITNSVTVHCDVCAHWCADGDFHQTTKAALEGARRMGWSRRRVERNGKITTTDICRRCLAAEAAA